MWLKYILIYITFGLLLCAIFNLILITSIRLTGSTPLYKLTKSDPQYKKIKEQYKKKSSQRAILLTIVALVVAASLTGLQMWMILRQHTPDSLSTIIIGFAFVLLIAVVGPIYLSKTYANTRSNKSNGRKRNL